MDSIAELLEGMAANKHDNHGTHCGESILEHTLGVMQCIRHKDPNNKALILAALFHDIGKPYVRKDGGNRILYYGHEKESARICNEVLGQIEEIPEAIRKEACWIVSHHLDPETGLSETGEYAKDLKTFMHCDSINEVCEDGTM